jgi:hypothetical protein
MELKVSLPTLFSSSQRTEEILSIACNSVGFFHSLIECAEQLHDSLLAADPSSYRLLDGKLKLVAITIMNYDPLKTVALTTTYLELRSEPSDLIELQRIVNQLHLQVGQQRFASHSLDLPQDTVQGHQSRRVSQT